MYLIKSSAGTYYKKWDRKTGPIFTFSVDGACMIRTKLEARTVMQSLKNYFGERTSLLNVVDSRKEKGA